MKLIRHYFKYDFLRWRALFIALWALAAVYVGLTGIVAGATTYDEHLLHLAEGIAVRLGRGSSAGVNATPSWRKAPEARSALSRVARTSRTT